jgi:hypothetical protein
MWIWNCLYVEFEGGTVRDVGVLAFLRFQSSLWIARASVHVYACVYADPSTTNNPRGLRNSSFSFVPGSATQDLDRRSSRPRKTPKALPLFFSIFGLENERAVGGCIPRATEPHPTYPSIHSFLFFLWADMCTYVCVCAFFF